MGAQSCTSSASLWGYPLPADAKGEIPLDFDGANNSPCFSWLVPLLF